VIFSQDTFNIPQIDGTSGQVVADIQRTFALSSTPRSISDSGATRIPSVQDGIGTGETDFKLVVKTKTGEYVEKTFTVHVTANWHDLSMTEIN